ncbi:MAG: hypothetical protein M3305_13880 [Actinomycetota bacterium]|nr:hypothetical protein [Actinomycetota bacterium]
MRRARGGYRYSAFTLLGLVVMHTRLIYRLAPQGVSVGLLRAAIEHARRSGGRIVEGYPVEPKKDRMLGVFAWTGLATAYRRVGFAECLRRSETRPIMRYEIP